MTTENTPEDEAYEREAYESITFGVTRKELDAMGERNVRDDFNSGVYGHGGGIPKKDFVEVWLKLAEFDRLAADSAKRDAREEETLSIAKDANKEARRANRLALIAIAITITSSIIIANWDSIGRLLISWFP